MNAPLEFPTPLDSRRFVAPPILAAPLSTLCALVWLSGCADPDLGADGELADAHEELPEDEAGTPTPAASVPLQAAPDSALTCTPAPEIDPALCNPEQPAPVPPAVDGECEIEVSADWVAFTEGQGFTETRAEASVLFEITEPDGSSSARRTPLVGAWKLTVGKERTVNKHLATYVVDENDTLDLELCATFTEHDSELIDINGLDDIGTDCRSVTLTCPQPEMDRMLEADLCRGGDCNDLNGAMAASVKIRRADADGDCVENIDDYTPDPCDELNKGQLCHASMVYFWYGDGWINDLAQNLGTNLSKAMTGYDRTVLMIDDNQIGPFNLDPAATDLADVVMAPTEANFFATLQDLTSRGCDITTWIHAHGDPVWVASITGDVSVGGGWISAQLDDESMLDPTQTPNITTGELTADTEPAASGTSSVPVRMTYSTACFYELWNQPWLDAGAFVTSGAIDIDFAPNFYSNFADLWNAGADYGTSVAGEFNVLDEALAFAFVLTQGEPPPWLCWVNTVLGRNACARNFFTDTDAEPFVDPNTGVFDDGPDPAKYPIGGPMWDLAGVTYDPTASGAQNMRASSVKAVDGDPFVTRFAPLVWP